MNIQSNWSVIASDYNKRKEESQKLAMNIKKIWDSKK